jgi:hypothetical protein
MVGIGIGWLGIMPDPDIDGIGLAGMGGIGF